MKESETMYFKEQKPLAGKVAVVTGGSRGIGRAISCRFASLGASVAFLYAGNEAAATETLSQLKEYGVGAVSYKCDVSDPVAIKEAFAFIKAELGDVDILVNNAGVTRDKLLLAMTEEDFDRVIDINLRGAFYAIKEVYPVMARRRSGRIINIGSISGLIGNAGQANYSASKAGLIGLTKTVARELAPRGVTCNLIAPGFIKTDMTVDFENTAAANIPMRRMGEPEEVAELAAFLASPAAAYITGEVIRIDGGFAM